MGIVTAGAKTPAAKAKPAPLSPMVRLELSVHNSFTKDGVRYEKGVVYEFTREQADIVLGWDSDSGFPVFKPYKPKAAPVARTHTPEGRPVVSMGNKVVTPTNKGEDVSFTGFETGDPDVTLGGPGTAATSEEVEV